MTTPAPVRRWVRQRLLLAMAMALAVVCTASTAPIGQAPGEGRPVFQTMRAADFLSTLGVNLHIGSDPYNEPRKLAEMLRFLGMVNVRQSSPIDDGGLARMQKLGKIGFKFDLIVNGGGPVDLDGAMRTVHDMAPYLNAVEGVNEAVIYPISYRGITGVDAAVALQKDLYAAVRASPALNGAAVYMFTIGGADPGEFPSIGDLSSHADFANIHSYPPHGLRPIFVIHAAIDGGRTSAASKSVVITETGYYTLPNHDEWGGVPEPVQANYLLGLLLDEAAAGVVRTYLYDLIDDGPDPERNNREHNFGLFRFDGSPKPAAIAIHNMTTILADAHPSARQKLPSIVVGSAVGVPYNHTGNTLAFEKQDGSQFLVLWNEQQTWHPGTRTAHVAENITVTVELPGRHGAAKLYDPLVSAEPISDFQDASKLMLTLTDHPLILALPPFRIRL